MFEMKPICFFLVGSAGPSGPLPSTEVSGRLGPAVPTKQTSVTDS